MGSFFLPGSDSGSHLVGIKRSQGSWTALRLRAWGIHRRRVVLVLELGHCGMKGRLVREIAGNLFGSRATIVDVASVGDSKI